MILEQHILDTMKEWQLKMGSIGSDIRLYYPKTSLVRYMEAATEKRDNVYEEMDNTELIKRIEEYIATCMPYLGKFFVTAVKDRFCIHILKDGCEYVEKNIPMPEFLTGLLEVLKEQRMDGMIFYFEDYASKNKSTLCREKDEEDGGLILYFADENVEPYVYCIDENEFGITYHRFTKEEYREL